MTDRTTEEAKREAFYAFRKRHINELTGYPPTALDAWNAALQWQAEQQKGDDGRGLEACVTCGQPAASPHGVPPGYVLAPVEPTPEMLRAANKLPDTFSLGDEYRAMLSSLPQEPQGERWTCPKCGVERWGPLIACKQDGCPSAHRTLAQGDSQ